MIFQEQFSGEPLLTTTQTLEQEARLVDLAMNGDFDAFAALYSLYMDAIYRYIYFRTGNPQDAEDLTEQVFLKAWEAIPRFRAMGCSFIHWLYRIAHNLVVDHHRHRALGGDESLPGDEGELPCPEESTLARVIQAEERACLAAAIRQLPDEQQQVIVLRFIEGMGHAEIARILVKTEVACRAIQHRALLALNKKLAPRTEKG